MRIRTRAVPRPAAAWPAVSLLVAALLAVVGCDHAQPPPLYEKALVERRSIVVSASASGAIEPVRTVDVKSKASGEIIAMKAETGDDVSTGALLAEIDPRTPRNTLEQAEAILDVAKAELANAASALARADTLFRAQAITETEHDTARIAYVNANASLVRARTDLDNARIQMQDTRVRAPVDGTIIAKNVEIGTVISSPTRDVGGGTVLLKMANLDTVQIRTLVDETDIGKVQPGLMVSIVVDAFPSRTFDGAVLKIEPIATVQQNVTMFPVLIRIANPGHLLKPGMNTEVEIHVGERENVLAIPYQALRTRRDIASAAAVLGLDPAAVEGQLAQAAGATADSAHGGRGEAQAATNPGAAPGANTMTTPDGRTIQLPPGVTEEKVRAAFTKRRNGQELSAEEQSMLRQVFSQAGGGRGGRAGGGAGAGGAMGAEGGAGARVGGSGNGGAARYIVFALRNGTPVPVEIRTGLTDLDYIEVVSGLSESDTVAVLPSMSLVNSQREMQERLSRMPGAGGIPGMRQQTPGSSTSGSSSGGTGGNRGGR